MKTAKMVALLVLVVLVVVVIMQNTDPVQMRFLWMTGQVPAVLLLFLTAAGGFIIGLIVTLHAKGGKGTTKPHP